ncbi:MerR family transcriptional regulator [Enterococcus termitis]|uniref:HTH merR-type domain-containing protein n=1 Tax=Enterococcus termitis TaxID=332950 RepID=A0A1E5GVK8_9ENTE|nr:MerR family transcriptional regulator [Enterococcus termitis]OEG16696.1 hypothetical protein BCR25_03610 [Enterococcus termitis]OJG99392.1 MerR family transcriptional regulator [Enterococcus termitis]
MYTVGEIAKMTDFSEHTLRYYDRLGLLPFVTKDQHGVRHFSESDLDLLATIRFMKDTGATTKEIKAVMTMIMGGDQTLKQRLDYYKNYREKMRAMVADLEANLEKIDWKIDYYQKAVAAGTEKIHDGEEGLYALYYRKEKTVE